MRNYEKFRATALIAVIILAVVSMVTWCIKHDQQIEQRNLQLAAEAVSHMNPSGFSAEDQKIWSSASKHPQICGFQYMNEVSRAPKPFLNRAICSTFYDQGKKLRYYVVIGAAEFQSLGRGSIVLINAQPKLVVYVSNNHKYHHRYEGSNAQTYADGQWVKLDEPPVNEFSRARHHYLY